MLVLLETPWHLFSAILVFVFGLLFSVVLSDHLSVPRTKASFLYLWHSMFSVIYILFSLNKVADSTKYYLTSLEDRDFGVGTSFIYAFTNLFSEGLGLSYLGTFLIYNIIGCVGLLAFYASLKQVVKGKSMGMKWLAMGVVMLPSVNFWSSAIGKDAISFMATGLSLWAALDIQRRKFLMAFAIFSMFLVRPHMAGMLMAALSAAVFFDANTKALTKIFLGTASVVMAAILIPFAAKYAGLLDLANLVAYIDQRQGYNQGGGSSLDISAMSFPVQLFTYAFRPLPYEAHNMMALLSSVDNLILLLICLLGLFGWFRWGIESRNANIMLLLIYVVIAWSLLAVTTGNLGIAVRQKWMFMPYLIFIAFCCLRRIPFSWGRRRLPRPHLSANVASKAS